MSSEHPDYYRSRATEERSSAANAASSEVATIHLELAERYETLVDDSNQGSPFANVMGWAQ